MPCDQRQEVSIEFGQATDATALADTLEALGFTEVVVLAGGKVRFRQGHFDPAEKRVTFYDSRRSVAADVLARAYTKATVLTQADRFQWATSAVSAAAKAVVGFSRRW